MTWTDADGRTLADYPRPSVAVDVALLTVPPPGDDTARLHALVHRRADGYAAGRWSLPGSMLRERERLAAAVRRALAVKTGIEGESPAQLGVLDEPGRDDRGWVLSAAHVDLVPYGRLAGALTGAVRLAPVVAGRVVLPDGQDELPFDHDRTVALAATWAADLYAGEPDPRRLLGEPFTLAQLRLLHQAVEGRRWQKDVFRRRFADRLVETGGQAVVTTGRPAALYRLS